MTGQELTGEDAEGRILFFDGDEAIAVLDGPEWSTFRSLVGSLDPVTTSACGRCESRVVASLALLTMLEAAPYHPFAQLLTALAEDAPTTHLYVIDQLTGCTHRSWIDPGGREWLEAVERCHDLLL